MTPTEKKYRKYIGCLFWSVRRNDLVYITSLWRTGKSWMMDVEYCNQRLTSKTSRQMTGTRILTLIRQGRWIPATEYIKSVPK
jgi:hypothetical protein